jgi:hypothetical protein
MKRESTKDKPGENIPDVHARKGGFKDAVKFCKRVPATVLADGPVIVV